MGCVWIAASRSFVGMGDRDLIHSRRSGLMSALAFAVTVFAVTVFAVAVLAVAVFAIAILAVTVLATALGSVPRQGHSRVELFGLQICRCGFSHTGE